MFIVFCLCVTGVISVIGWMSTPPLSGVVGTITLMLSIMLSYRLGWIINSDAEAEMYHRHAKFWEHTASAVAENADRYKYQRNKWKIRLQMGIPVARRRERAHTLKMLGLILHIDDDKTLLPEWFFKVEGDDK
jgi:hypothetical protein